MLFRKLLVVVLLFVVGVMAIPQRVAAQCIGLQCTQTAVAQTVTASVATETANSATITAQVATQTAVANTSTAANWTHVAIMSTQTAVAQITPSATPIPYYRYEEIDGVWTRWDYNVSAGEILIGGLTLLLVLTLWIFAALFIVRSRRNK